jgi:hypothetical protein
MFPRLRLSQPLIWTSTSKIELSPREAKREWSDIMMISPLFMVPDFKHIYQRKYLILIKIFEYFLRAKVDREEVSILIRFYLLFYLLFTQTIFIIVIK